MNERTKDLKDLHETYRDAVDAFLIARERVKSLEIDLNAAKAALDDAQKIMVVANKAVYNEERSLNLNLSPIAGP